MTKEELLAVVDKTAENELRVIFPIVLNTLEREFHYGSTVVIPLDLEGYNTNMAVTIMNKIVQRLEGLGYDSHSRLPNEVVVK